MTHVRRNRGERTRSRSMLTCQVLVAPSDFRPVASLVGLREVGWFARRTDLQYCTTDVVADRHSYAASKPMRGAGHELFDYHRRYGGALYDLELPCTESSLAILAPSSAKPER
jgi:hypothetical protein